MAKTKENLTFEESVAVSGRENEFFWLPVFFWIILSVTQCRHRKFALKVDVR